MAVRSAVTIWYIYYVCTRPSRIRAPVRLCILPSMTDNVTAMLTLQKSCGKRSLSPPADIHVNHVVESEKVARCVPLRAIGVFFK